MLTWSNQLSFNWRHQNLSSKGDSKVPHDTLSIFGSFFLWLSDIPFLISCDLNSEVFYDSSATGDGVRGREKENIIG